jgi:hypothetical protein
MELHALCDNGLTERNLFEAVGGLNATTKGQMAARGIGRAIDLADGRGMQAETIIMGVQVDAIIRGLTAIVVALVGLSTIRRNNLESAKLEREVALEREESRRRKKKARCQSVSAPHDGTRLPRRSRPSRRRPRRNNSRHPP